MAATTLAELSVSAAALRGVTSVRRGAAQRAIALWRRQGVVIFPSLLSGAVVARLREHVMAATADAVTVDRTANIRDPFNRTLRALAIADAAVALEAISEVLGPSVHAHAPAMCTCHVHLPCNLPCTCPQALEPFLRHAMVDAELLVLEVAAYRAAPGAQVG